MDQRHGINHYKNLFEKRIKSRTVRVLNGSWHWSPMVGFLADDVTLKAFRKLLLINKYKTVIYIGNCFSQLILNYADSIVDVNC